MINPLPEADESTPDQRYRAGYTAFEISSYRPEARTFIFTPNRSLLNTLNLVWGVKGFFYDKMESTDESINDVNTILKEEKMVEEGDVVINTSSMPILKKGKTNMIKVSIID